MGGPRQINDVPAPKRDLVGGLGEEFGVGGRWGVVLTSQAYEKVDV